MCSLNGRIIDTRGMRKLPLPQCSSSCIQFENEPRWLKTLAVFALLAMMFASPTDGAVTPSAPKLGLQITGGYASVSVTGTVGTAWTIQFATNLAGANLWLPLASLTLSNATTNFVRARLLPHGQPCQRGGEAIG